MLIRKRKRALSVELSLIPEGLDTVQGVASHVEKGSWLSDAASKVELLFQGVAGLLVHHRLDDVSKATMIPTFRLRSFMDRSDEPNLDEVMVIYSAFGLHISFTVSPVGTSATNRTVLLGG